MSWLETEGDDRTNKCNSDGNDKDYETSAFNTSKMCINFQMYLEGDEGRPFLWQSVEFHCVIRGHFQPQNLG